MSASSLRHVDAVALLVPGSFLEPLGHGVFGLFQPANACIEPVRQFPAAIVKALEKRKLFVADRFGRLTLTDLGRSRLARQVGSSLEQSLRMALSVRRIEADDGARRPVLINDAESPLAWLARRAGKNGTFLSPEQFEAGERLRRDFTFAGLEPSLTADWTRPRTDGGGGSGGAASLQDSTLDARRRVQAALVAVGPELSGILLDICCFLKGIEDAEHGQGWPARSGKIVLRLALQRLARHYGLCPQEERPLRTRRWGADDYRPQIE